MDLAGNILPPSLHRFEYLKEAYPYKFQHYSLRILCPKHTLLQNDIGQGNIRLRHYKWEEHLRQDQQYHHHSMTKYHRTLSYPWPTYKNQYTIPIPKHL